MILGDSVTALLGKRQGSGFSEKRGLGCVFSPYQAEFVCLFNIGPVSTGIRLIGTDVLLWEC